MFADPRFVKKELEENGWRPKTGISMKALELNLAHWELMTSE